MRAGGAANKRLCMAIETERYTDRQTDRQKRDTHRQTFTQTNREERQKCGRIEDIQRTYVVLVPLRVLVLPVPAVKKAGGGGRGQIDRALDLAASACLIGSKIGIDQGRHFRTHWSFQRCCSHCWRCHSWGSGRNRDKGNREGEDETQERVGRTDRRPHRRQTDTRHSGRPTHRQTLEGQCRPAVGRRMNPAKPNTKSWIES